MSRFKAEGSAFQIQPPVYISRRAIRIFGPEVAIIAQQFVYWTLNPNCSLSGMVDEDGTKWVHFTLDQLAKEFDWTSKSTIRRAISLLESCQFLLSRNPGNYCPKEYTVSQGIMHAIETGKLTYLDHATGVLLDAPPAQIEQAALPAQNEQRIPAQIGQRAAAQIEQPSYISLPKSHSYCANADDKHPQEGTAVGSKPQRSRNQIWDAVCEVCRIDTTAMTKVALGLIGKVVKQIKEASPDVTPEMVRLKAAEYHRQFPTAQLTPSALVKHWPSLNIGFRKQQPAQNRITGPLLEQNPEAPDFSKVMEAAEAADGGAR